MADFLAFRFDGKEYRLPALMLAEARAMQKATGMTPRELFSALEQLDAEALTAVVWIARKRENPTLRFDDVDGDLFSFEQIKDEDDEDEDGDAPGEAEAPEPSETTPGP